MLTIFVARLSARLPENSPGDYFVDDSCIDCETCRILAPQVFARSARRGLSIVQNQPGTREQELRARMAIVSCPTSAIGTSDKVDLLGAVAALPDAIIDDVFYCGYASESSYGAASYLVRRDRGKCSWIRRVRLGRSWSASRPSAASPRCSSPIVTTSPTTRNAPDASVAGA